jgi:hypothetical protein
MPYGGSLALLDVITGKTDTLGYFGQPIQQGKQYPVATLTERRGPAYSVPALARTVSRLPEVQIRQPVRPAHCPELAAPLLRSRSAGRCWGAAERLAARRYVFPTGSCIRHGDELQPEPQTGPRSI